MKRFFTLFLAVSCLTAVGQLPDYVPTDGLVAWYDLDGDALDGSGNGNHGELFGPTPSENRFGQPESSLDFKREELDYITTDIDNILGDGHRSVALWVRINEGRMGGFVLSYGPELFESSCNAGFHIDAWLGDCDFVGVGVGSNCYQRRLPFEQLDDNAWHHIVITYSGGGLANTQYWFDGVLQQQMGCTQGSLPSALNTTTLFGMSIGKRNDDNANSYFDGLVDDVGVFDRALSPAEITALYSSTALSQGCTNAEACNFDLEAIVDDGSCLYYDDCGECGGTSIAGCIDDQACNFDAEAACDNGSCDYSCCPGPGCCLDGQHWDWELNGCVITNPADINLDGCVQLNDLLDLLSAYGDCGAEESVWQCGDPLEYQGYDYATVQIGEQCWFAENLRSETYRNGEEISNFQSDEFWSSTSFGAQCAYGNLESAVAENGRLYNGYAVLDDRQLCPVSWHVPSEDDFETLELLAGVPSEEIWGYGFRGTAQGAGQKLKSQSGWCCDGNGWDEFGFRGEPGGLRSPQGVFELGISHFYFWGSSIADSTTLWRRELHFENHGIYRNPESISYGMSVRCIQDSE